MQTAPTTAKPTIKEKANLYAEHHGLTYTGSNNGFHGFEGKKSIGCLTVKMLNKWYKTHTTPKIKK